MRAFRENLEIEGDLELTAIYKFLGLEILPYLTFQTVIVAEETGAHFLDVFYF